MKKVCVVANISWNDKIYVDEAIRDKESAVFCHPETRIEVLDIDIPDGSTITVSPDGQDTDLMHKIIDIAQKLPGLMHNELYPLEDSKRVFAGIYDVRTAILSKYIGMHEVLEALGCPALELSAVLEEELSKLEASKK